MTVLCSCYCYLFVIVIHRYTYIYIYVYTFIHIHTLTFVIRSTPSRPLFSLFFSDFQIYFVATHEKEDRSTQVSEEEKREKKKVGKS